MSFPTLIPAPIASGQALSGQIDLGDKTLVGIIMPAAWTAAGLTFQVSPDGGATFIEHTNSAGAATNFTVAASQYIAVDPALWRGVNSLKLRSGTSGAPVNQGALAAIILVVRPVL
ncbi:hypothetical protein QM467_04740 [Rhodoblastus sp. 17X3]|uniref:hypothetical protein n=1 Tax=Rhodoblastus sp. 17X3 TaxID=3047026 RepID=UPI0024B6D12E|nr:hypothetical protein [Rhodoblastus sp. 17X3]MDI9847367.1 hypothetical protein [Rhodoblastus sp. 17X3]